MATHTSLTSLRNAQKIRFAKIYTDIQEVHKVIAEDGKEDFVDSTQGKVKKRTLRRMGYPFGRSGGAGSKTGVRGIQGNAKKFKASGGKIRKGVLAPLPINEQSGDLHREISMPGPVGKRKTYSLYSAVPYAKFVLHPKGTKKMVARGLLGPWGLLRKRHKARMAAYVDLCRRKQRRSY